MKYVIIGGVAGGATAAARLRRIDEHQRLCLRQYHVHRQPAQRYGLPVRLFPHPQPRAPAQGRTLFRHHPLLRPGRRPGRLGHHPVRHGHYLALLRPAGRWLPAHVPERGRGGDRRGDRSAGTAEIIKKWSSASLRGVFL